MTLIEQIEFARFFGFTAGKSKRRDRRMTGRLKGVLAAYAKRRGAQIRAWQAMTRRRSATIAVAFSDEG